MKTFTVFLAFAMLLPLLPGCALKTVTAPTQDQKRCEILNRLEVHGHRGTWDRPENTVAAFRRAIAQGADFIEMDLQMTADNDLVVAHDAFMKPLCNTAAGRPIKTPLHYRNLTLAEIKTYDCGSRVNAGDPEPGEKIPSFAEVLKSFKGEKTLRGGTVGLNLEIKYDERAPQFYPPRAFYIERLLARLDESQIDKSQVMLQSFDHEILKQIHVLRPELKLSPLFGDKTELKTAMKIAAELGADRITPYHGLVTPEFLKGFREAGIRVIPWTVNSPPDALKMIDLGVDGIITDHPEWYTSRREDCSKGR